MARRPPGQRDVTDMKRNGESPRDDRLPDQVQRRWWAIDKRDVAQSVCSTVAFLQRMQSARMRQHVVSARLYGNMAMMGSAAGAYSRLLSSNSAVRDRITFNAIQSIIDTLTSRIGETKPRPYYLTSGGTYAAQRRAKKLNQFTEGVFYETQTYDKGLDCFRDSAVWGDGLMHVYGRAGKLHHERVLSNELWVDDMEAMLGFPRNMFRVKDVDREEAMAWMSDNPDAVEAVKHASRIADTEANRGDNTSDMVRIVEAWHLSAMDEDGKLKGGKRALVVDGAKDKDNGLLDIEDWPYDFFPFARLPWCKRPVGFWSQGLCEQLQGEQLELNKELWFVQRSMQLAGTVKVFLRNGSKISKEHLNNEVGAIVEYTGEAPQFFCPEPIHPVFFENINRIIERMYRQAGVSEMSAEAKKPAGLNSGAAQREFNDQESARHRTTSRLNDNFYLAIAALDATFAGELRDYSVKVPGRNAFNKINFKKDIGKLDDDDFIRQCFPVSRLPRDPAGRLQTIQEYIQAGFMTPRQGRRALGFPDLDTIESLANAQEDILSKVLDDIMDEGKYRPPEPTDDLPAAKEMVLEYIQRARQYEDDDMGEKIDLLRRWSSQVDSLMKRALSTSTAGAPGVAPQGMPPGAPPGGTPQGQPMQAPQSDLLPQAA